MKTIIVTDLGFGDAGKGSITDFLTRHYGAELVVRYNGGAQAAHAVVTPEGVTHTFHQFGSGTLIPGTRTLLSEFMLVNPLALIGEEQDLRRIGVTDAFALLYLHSAAKVTTPYHMIANRLRELARGAGRHGSCGLGIGETVSDSLRYPEETLFVGDLRQPAVLAAKLRLVRDRKRREMAALERSLAVAPDAVDVADLLTQLHSDDEFAAALEVFQYIGEVAHIVGEGFLAEQLGTATGTIFEGAQGVLLDEDYGFHPHTTWSHTTTQNADRLLHQAGFDGPVTRFGLLRAYQTRHGAGPFPTESPELTAALPDPHNPINPWQGGFRCGWLDLVLTRYALQVAGPIDALAISCLDQLPESPRVATAYRLNGMPYNLIPPTPGNLTRSEQIGNDLKHVVPRYTDAPRDPHTYAQWIAEQLDRPLAITSFGPTANDKNLLTHFRFKFFTEKQTPVENI